MAQLEVNYPQMTYDEVVLLCKKCAEEIRAEGIDLLVSDYEAAIDVSDRIAYPLDMQAWITEDYPILYEIVNYAAAVDSNHTDRASWEKLLELIDSL